MLSVQVSGSPESNVGSFWTAWRLNFNVTSKITVETLCDFDKRQLLKQWNHFGCHGCFIYWERLFICTDLPPALITLNISKQWFTKHPHKENRLFVFLMTMVRVAKAFQEKGMTIVCTFLYFSSSLSMVELRHWLARWCSLVTGRVSVLGRLCNWSRVVIFSQSRAEPRPDQTLTHTFTLTQAGNRSILYCHPLCHEYNRSELSVNHHRGMPAQGSRILIFPCAQKEKKI